jgi:hypothetical protein
LSGRDKKNRMRIIRTQLHGLLDYGFVIILLLPWITNYAAAQKDTIVFSAIGFGILMLNMVTDYEWGFIKLIPMRVHLLFDLAINVLIMAMPLLFPVINYNLYWPVLLGATGLLITIMSSYKPYLHKAEDVDITKPYH